MGGVMKAQIIPYPPPPREVVVTMSEEEAQSLYAGSRYGDSSSIWATLAKALYDAGVR